MIDREAPMARVLVVEDEPSIRLLMTTILQRHEYDVLEAIHGADALLVLEASPTVDLIITDLRMPIMDGIQLIDSVRPRFPDLPILVMAASKAPIMEALKRGANSYLLKPFSYATFLSTLCNPPALEID
jgi:CheY-like chemotaxis protein